jgi:capsular exopolysaccharide synthesis family protein
MTANPISNIPPLGPMSGPAPGGPTGPFKPVDPMKLLRQHMRLLIIAAVAGIILGIGLWGALRYLTPRYTSPALLHVSPPLAEADSATPTQTGGRGALDEIEAFIQSEIQRLKSDEVLTRAIRRSEVQQTDWFKQFSGKAKLDDALLALQEDDFNASSIRGAPLMRLAVHTTNKDDAKVILENIIVVYLDELDQLTARDSESLRRMFIEEQTRWGNQVEQLTEARNRFTRENDLDALNERNVSIRMTFENLERQRLQLEYALAETQAMYNDLKMIEEAGGEPTADQVQSVMQRPDMIQRQQRINEMKAELESLKAGGYGNEHRAVRRTRERVEAMENELEAAQERLVREQMAGQIASASRAIESLKSQLSALTGPIADAQRRMIDVRAKLDEFEALTERLTKAQEEYDEAVAGLAEVRMRLAHPYAQRVRRQAGPDDAELTFPKPEIIIPGLTILLLGAVTGLLFLREMLDTRLRSPADVKMLANVSMLGMLPDASEDPSGATRVERVVERQPAGLMAEAFRQVRTAILSRMDRRGYRSLVVASAQPASGSSTVAQNLAASVALNGRRVLLIDANFRRPSQHGLMGVDNGQGLYDVLTAKVVAEDVIYPIEGMPLSVMPTGQAAEAAPELFEGQAFRTLMARLESAFDLIVIDTAPTLLTSDSQMLAKQVDAIAIVVRASVDKRGMIDRMVNQLDGQRADILGVILNGVRSSAGGYFRKSYQEFYRYRQPANGSVDLASGRMAGPSNGDADQLAAAVAEQDDDGSARER